MSVNAGAPRRRGTNGEDDAEPRDGAGSGGGGADSLLRTYCRPLLGKAGGVAKKPTWKLEGG